jgi:XapX domain-containing protein
MNWLPYAISLAVGLGIGVIYGVLNVRSPAPPIIALIGLLGILAGETAVSYLRGHPNAIARLLHLKSFAISEKPKPVHTEPPSTQA